MTKLFVDLFGAVYDILKVIVLPFFIGFVVVGGLLYGLAKIFQWLF